MKTGNTSQCVQPAKVTDELILWEGDLDEVARNATKSRIPIWTYPSIDDLFDIDVPGLYRLTIYTKDDFSEVIDSIVSRFRDSCHCLEVATWNDDLDDYEWFIDDPDTNYVEQSLEGEIETDENQEVVGECFSNRISFDDYLEGARIGSEYIVKKNGLWVIKKDEYGDRKKILLSHSGILVVGMARTENQKNWMKLLVWIDADGKIHEQLLPSEAMHSFSGVKEFFCSNGCEFPPNVDKYLKEYLISCRPEARYRLVHKTGWYTDSEGCYQFALPNQVVGSHMGEPLYFHPDSAINCNGIGQKGSLYLWQKHVAGAASGNPLLIFMLSAAFASPLLRFTNGETGGFHLYGQTSRGKTTAMLVAASVWGNAAPPSNTFGKSFINTWKTTANALEAVAAARNDILLILDEIGQIEFDNVAKTVYDLCSGAGKERMNRYSSLTDKLQWREIFLSTGEVSAREVMERFGAQVKGGQLIRLIDLDIEEGIIQDPHDLSSEEFVDSLRSHCANHYGWAGPLFVEELIAATGSSEGERELKEGYAYCCDLLYTQHMEEAKFRVLKRFALVLLAGISAVRFGILPLEEDEVVSAVQSICSKWLKTSESLNDAIRAIENIKNYLAANIGRFHAVDSNKAVPSNCLGFKKKISGEDFYLFSKETFAKAVNASNHREIIRKLNSLSLLHINNKRRYQARFNDPSSNDSNSPKVSFYTISAKILDYGEPVTSDGRKMRRVKVPKRKDD